LMRTETRAEMIPRAIGREPIRAAVVNS
jgi:hypothetical protein